MGTNIKTIKGTYHIDNAPNIKVIKGNAEINLYRFWGGNKDKAQIQISIEQEGNDYSYIHLNEKQCKELAKVLLKCF